jgi:quinol monooxygenase YgiN
MKRMMRTILNRTDNGCQSRRISGVLVVIRFRVPAPESEAFRAAVEEAHAALAEQRGYVGGAVGRNVDDPELWLLQTTWEGPGAYRRALSAYDVKVRAWALLGRALDEPGAYETVTPGLPTTGIP